jgi:hypothetical protein
MVEGKIALDFGGRSRDVTVEKDQQVVLDSIALDSAGRVTSLPANIAPTDIPTALKASLANAAQSLIDAAAIINFQAMKPAETPPQAYPQSGGSNPAGSGPDSVTPNATGGSSSFYPLSPVPPAMPPAPRTTPGDGKV